MSVKSFIIQAEHGNHWYRSVDYDDSETLEEAKEKLKNLSESHPSVNFRIAITDKVFNIQATSL